jgi:hypothetical protein
MARIPNLACVQPLMSKESRMGITLLSFERLFAPLQALAACFAPPRAAAVRPTALPPRAVRSTCQPRRVVRVVRVVEGPCAPASAGRMFMSGRMADVCAELDRLAALEAASPAR